MDIALVLTELPPPYERLMLELDIQAALELDDFRTFTTHVLDFINK